MTCKGKEDKCEKRSKVRLGWAWWLVVYEGCKRKSAIGNCRILNLGSGVEDARENLEDGPGRKDSSLTMNFQ